jgi:hypothetical protein
MYRRTRPDVGHWYFDLDREVFFRIVAMDYRSETIAMQHYDGELEEIDFDDFIDMDLRRTGQPKDWRGPYEVDGDEDEWAQDPHEEFPEYAAEHMQIVDHV